MGVVYSIGPMISELTHELGADWTIVAIAVGAVFAITVVVALVRAYLRLDGGESYPYGDDDHHS